MIIWIINMFSNRCWLKMFFILNMKTMNLCKQCLHFKQNSFFLHLKLQRNKNNNRNMRWWSSKKTVTFWHQKQSKLLWQCYWFWWSKAKNGKKKKEKIRSIRFITERCNRSFVGRLKFWDFRGLQNPFGSCVEVGDVDDAMRSNQKLCR